MQTPVVTMTPEAYFSGWTVRVLIAAPFVLAAAYVVLRYAVRWGVGHGMERFVGKEPTQR